ncbi:MAG TPA: MBL fold metallo-hydrolase [Pyrinomonadaceae bacterium]|nr:MBL fold metallo-hydrolase [Pyrinomonadaceae bacterium]
MSQRPDDSVRALFSPVFDYVKNRGLADIIAQSPTLLQRSADSEAFRNHCEYHDGAHWRLRPEILYPDPQLAQPEQITIYRNASDESVTISLSGDDWRKVHRLIAGLAGQEAMKPDLDSGERDLISVLSDERLVAARNTNESRGSAFDAADITFIGHNTALIRSPEASVIIDPFFCAAGEQYPSSYQPLTIHDFGKIDAILITHSHPDHFDPASLLQFSTATRIIVPDISRETILAVDMAARLNELGFTNCERLAWDQSVRILDLELHALPFYGEQPTNLGVLHPEIRNYGNTYVVRTPRYSAAFVADSGRDAAGDVKDVAKEWHRRFGPIDVLFAGYRGWETYAVQLLFSSVSRYILFVPSRLWNTRLQLMNNIDNAIDLAEYWGARYLVPYGDGGAPWYWQIGLGPKLDDQSSEDTAFDPFPERVIERANLRKRNDSANALETILLRPGESIGELPGRASILRVDGHIWPYQM